MAQLLHRTAPRSWARGPARESDSHPTRGCCPWEPSSLPLQLQGRKKKKKHGAKSRRALNGTDLLLVFLDFVLTFLDRYCGWLRDPATVASYWVTSFTVMGLEFGTLPIHQLVQNFATIHRITQRGFNISNRYLKVFTIPKPGDLPEKWGEPLNIHLLMGTWWRISWDVGRKFRKRWMSIDNRM